MRKHERASRLRAYAVATAAAAVGALAFAGSALAATTTTTVSTEAQLETAITSFNSAPAGSVNVINLTGGNYQPAATLNITNATTGSSLTFQGTVPNSTIQQTPAKFAGGVIVPVGATLFSVKSGVNVTFTNIAVAGAGSSGNAIIDDSGTVTVNGSTINGTGPSLTVQSGGTATVNSSTMGDGLDVGLIDNGTLTLNNTTVTRNTNGGIDNTLGTLNLNNSIVAKNNNPTSKDCYRAATTSDHSLDGDGTCALNTALANANKSATDPLLGPLQLHGSSTAADFPASTSPVIDAGNAAKCPAADQRGAASPDVASTNCDIGAVETYYGIAPILTTPNQTVSSPSASGTVATYTVTWKGGSPVTGATCSPASGSTFPVGTTTVTCSGGADSVFGGPTGSQTFTVTDTQPAAPVVTVPPNTTIAAVDATGATFTFTATASDNGTSVPTTCTPASGSKFAIKSPGPATTVTCTATDANGTGTASFVVTVTDQTPPVITVPANITVQQTPAGGTSTVVNYTATALDNVDGSITPTCVPASGSAFPVNTTTTVTCNAKDAAGNAAVPQSFTVTNNATTPNNTNANVTGSVGATGALQITAGVCNLNTIIPAQTNTYLCTDPLTVSSSDTTAFLTVNDVSTAATTGHLVNGTYSLASQLKAKATSTTAGTTSTGFGLVPGPSPTAPYQLLSWSAPVNNDAVTLTGQQAVASTETLHNGTYAATVLLQLGGTP